MFDPPKCLVFGTSGFAGHRNVCGLVWSAYFAGRKVRNSKIKVDFIFNGIFFLKTSSGTPESGPIRR